MNKIPITDTDELNSLCVRLASSEYLTVDTEFLRTSTYYSKLCLIQIANENGAWAIDPLAEKLDLTAFYQLLNDTEYTNKLYILSSGAAVNANRTIIDNSKISINATI